MIDWFTDLALSEQIFSAMAIGFGGLLTVIMLFSVLGADIDIDAEADIDIGDGAFSVKGVLAFLAFFGLGAWIMARAGSPVWLSIVVGLIAGYAVMSLLTLMLAKLRGLDSSGNRIAQRLLLQEGEVYLTIPPSGQGAGRMQVRQGSRLVEVEALTLGASIPSGSRAKVVEVLGPARVLVEPIKLVRLN